MRTIRLIRTAAAGLALAVAASSAASSAPAPAPAARAGRTALPEGSLEFVFASGLDHGPVGGASPGMHQSDGAGTTLEWRSGFARTGRGAYHAVGGDLQGDETISNNASAMPFGGPEVWVGGAFRFMSFPDGGEDVWLMATVPTDGDSGADNKPVATIDSEGRVRLTGSNTPALFAESDTALRPRRWYSLVLHGRNGVSRTQQLFIYNGRTDVLIERLDLVLDVTGSFLNRLTKWGFGTSQDSGGLEYYLDDIFHARGDRNPGPVRVFSRNVITVRGRGFVPVGAPTRDGAVDDTVPDADASYLASAADAGRHGAVFGLTPLRLGDGDTVYAVQVTAIGRSTTSESLTARAGMRIRGHPFTGPVTLGPEYSPRLLMWSEDPSTGRPWSTRLGFSGVLKDLDALADEMRFTTMWWDVVYVAT